MVSQKKFLEIVYWTATCFIQTEELDDEQLEALDNISCARAGGTSTPQANK